MVREKALNISRSDRASVSYVSNNIETRYMQRINMGKGKN